MQYNFSKTLEADSKTILTELREKYLSCSESYNTEKIKKIQTYYIKIVTLLEGSFSCEEIQQLYKELALYKISINIPYIIMSNEIYGLKNLLLSRIAKNPESTLLLDLISLFHDISNSVARVYLLNYIQQLTHVNNIRLSSLSDLIAKDDVIKHYEAHIKWLTDLAKHIENADKTDFPELDYAKCAFGKWLRSDAKQLIHNNSKYKTLQELHQELHLFAKKIFLHLETEEYHVLISYLEKCELISLGIGTELILIDNMYMNTKISKDVLTGALNRNSLSLIFKTQYELSCAIGNSFVLAMCDLDYFKNVNDTYGHVAGDKILALFVSVVQRHIRNSDFIIRYGGEEFIIILPATKRESGFEVLEKIRKDFAAEVLFFENNNIGATVSIGAMWIEPKEPYQKSLLEQYLMIADKLLYEAKEAGRNRLKKL